MQVGNRSIRRPVPRHVARPCSPPGCPAVLCSAVVCFRFFVFREGDFRDTTIPSLKRFYSKIFSRLRRGDLRYTKIFLLKRFYNKICSRLRRGDFRYTTMLFNLFPKPRFLGLLFCSRLDTGQHSRMQTPPCQQNPHCYCYSLYRRGRRGLPDRVCLTPWALQRVI